ncbi:Hypothetical predicted protein, partial [Podarcis lilfordi]
MMIYRRIPQSKKQARAPGGLFLLGRNPRSSPESTRHLSLQSPLPIGNYSQRSTGPVDVAATVAGGQGREGTDVPPPHYSTSNDLKFSYSEINFQDLSWSFRNLYKSMLEKSSSSQHDFSSLLGDMRASNHNYYMYHQQQMPSS